MRTERRTERARRLSTWGFILLAVSACAKPATAPSLPAVTDPDAFRNEVPSPGPRPDIHPATPTAFVLPNGFRVLSLPWTSGTTALELACRVGSGSDPEGQSGVTALLGRMLTEGSENKSALEQAIEFEALGASLEHDVGVDTLSLSTEVLPADTDRAIGLLAEALRRPGLRAKDFERVRSEHLDSLRAQRQDPEQVVWLLAQRAVFGPVRGRPGSGTPKDVAKLEVAQLKERHRRELGPERCALLVAGSFEQRGLEESAQAAFADWPKSAPGTTSPSPAPQPVHLGELLFLPRADAVQSAIIIARPLPNRMDPGYEARQVVDDLFGGLFTSRLNTNLRERHAFTYGASSRAYASRDTGAWFLSTSVHTEVTAEALQEAYGEVARLVAEPPTDEELARARADLIQRRRSRLEHDTRLLADLAEAFAFELPLEYSSQYAARLDALGREDFDAAARNLSSGPLVTVVVGAKEVEAALSAGGQTVTPVDASWLE